MAVHIAEQEIVRSRGVAAAGGLRNNQLHALERQLGRRGVLCLVGAEGFQIKTGQLGDQTVQRSRQTVERDEVVVMATVPLSVASALVGRSL